MLKDFLTFAATLIPTLLAIYAIIITTQIKVNRNATDYVRLSDDLGELNKYLNLINANLSEVHVIQKITTETLTGLILRVERTESRQNITDKEVAILKATCETRHA